MGLNDAAIFAGFWPYNFKVYNTTEAPARNLKVLRYKVP